MNRLIEFAKKYSAKAHDGQMYGNYPYTKHLEDVSKVLTEFGHVEGTNEGNILQIASFLHDIIEDCGKSYFEIITYFGSDVADIVLKVSDERNYGDNRKTRKAKTYLKIRGNKLATILKLADRIANVRASIESNKGLFKMYKKEQKDFKNNLYIPNMADSMWDCLERLLNERNY